MSENFAEALAPTTEAETMPHVPMQARPAIADIASIADLKPITEESPQLLAAQASMKAILESLPVTPAAGGETGTLSVGDVQAKVVKDFGADNTAITFSTPVTALNSISVDAINDSLLKELAQYDFFKEHYDLSKAKDIYFGSSDKDVLGLIKEIATDTSVELPAELKQKIESWTTRHEKNGGHGAYIFNSSLPSAEDEKNRVSFRIDADGKSPTDDAIAAKDFVAKNIEERKTDILTAVIQAALELDAKHAVEKGTPLFTPEEKAKLDVNLIGKIGGLDMVIEDTSYGKSGDVNLTFGTKKEVAADCKDLPKDQLDATPLSKLEGELRNELIAKAVRTAGSKASEIYSIVAGSDVLLSEIKEALGEKGAAFTERLNALLKDTAEAKLTYSEKEASRAKKPQITVDQRFKDDVPNRVNINVPVPEGMTPRQVLEGITASKAVAAHEQDALSRFIEQNALGNHRDGEPKEPGAEPGYGDEPGMGQPKPDEEMKVVGGKTGVNPETPNSVEPGKNDPTAVKTGSISDPHPPGAPGEPGTAPTVREIAAESPDSVDSPKIGPAVTGATKPDRPGKAPSVAEASPVITEASLAASKVAELPKTAAGMRPGA